ncbi:MAG: GNAT family N-acetyltransferase [Leptolyngbya sp.]|nr:GNAT family N-acetyltransferase [Leptolyngbya sp.]
MTTVPIPTLHTDRLWLRPFSLADAALVEDLAGDRDIAARTLTIPHPYPPGLAAQWIRCHGPDFAEGKSVNWAIVRRDGHLCGAMGLGLVREFHLAELGYWIGRPFWGQGYCTEAARAVIAYGFDTLGLNRIQATHFADNPASGRVMEKIGMTYEGCRRQHTVKWGEFKDIKLYGILHSDRRP